MTGSRPMTIEEKYFTFLDQAWPMNIMIVAELATCPPAETVEAAWRQVASARCFVRLAASDDLRLRDLGTEGCEFTVREVSGEGWRDVIDEESRIAYPLGIAMRCRYLRSPQEGRSWIVLVGHHAVVDGRIGVHHLQLLVRAIAGQSVPEQQEISAPTPRPTWPWTNDRRALLGMLRGIRDQHEVLGDVGPLDWPHATEDRTPRTGPLIWEGEEWDACASGMRRRGIRPLPTLSAIWLTAAQRVLDGRPSATLQLGTAVDVGEGGVPPDALAPMTIGVLTNRFRVESATGPWPLAEEIAGTIRSSMDAGHGSLFFDLARIGPVDDLRTGAALTAQLVGAAPPTVSVTNLGVIDPGTDPPWLRWMCGYMAPTPNQVVFVSGLTYRGQLVNSATFDTQRVSEVDARRMVEQVRTMMGELALTP